MKKSYLFGLVILFTGLHLKTWAQQPTWVIYNDSNSTIGTDEFGAIAVDQTGNIWAGSFYNGLCRFNGTTWTVYNDFNSNILYYKIDDIAIDNNNKVWAANYKGISVFNGTNFTNYDTSNAGFKGQSVYKINKAPNGKLWMSSKNGSFGNESITVYDGTTWTNLTGLPSQAANEEVNGYAFGANNDVWMGTEAGMLLYNGSAFTYYPPAVTDLWSAGAITKDADGNIWAGGFDGLLKRDVTANTWTFYQNVDDMGFPQSNIGYFEIYPDGDFLWIGTSHGFVKFNRLTGTVVANYNASNSPLPTNGVYDIDKDNAGNFWLATTKGVVKMTVGGSSGLNETAGLQLNVFPNPSTNGVFRLETANQTNISYAVYTINGLLIQNQRKESGIHTIDLTSEAPGVYLLHTIASNGTTKISKLVKH